LVSSNNERRLDQIEQDISTVLNYRSSLINELKNLANKKQELRMEITKIIKKGKEQKKVLTEHNELISELISTRKEKLHDIRKINERIKKVKVLLKDFENKVPHESGDALTEKLKKIEWKLQTERLSREEEKQLVEYIKHLEIKIHLWKKAYTTRQELENLLFDVNLLKEDLDKIRATKESITAETKIKRENFNNIWKAKEQILTEINEVEKDVAELEEDLLQTDARLSDLRDIRHKIIEEKNLEKGFEQKKLLDKVKSNAKQKLAQGNSLSWEELKIIFEDESGESLSK
jgi:uncharacterized coiled-coil DUF342 family protein